MIRTTLGLLGSNGTPIRAAVERAVGWIETWDLDDPNLVEEARLTREALAQPEVDHWVFLTDAQFAAVQAVMEEAQEYARVNHYDETGDDDVERLLGREPRPLVEAWPVQ